MKKFSWITAFILNIVTFGIYSMYMFHVMTKNNNKIAKEKDVKHIKGFITALLLGCITFGIYSIIWLYKFMAQEVALAKACGVKVQPVEEPILLLIITCIPIYSFYVLCENYNAVVEAA